VPRARNRARNPHVGQRLGMRSSRPTYIPELSATT
jgi:hypothetical protein